MRSKYFLATASFCLLSSSALGDGETERAVSRITALWKDAQIELVKEQAETFLIDHPEDRNALTVRMALADSYRIGKEYEKTLSEIQKIPEDQQTLDIKLIYIDALYQLQNYSAVCAHVRAILNVIDFETNVEEKKALISAYGGLSIIAQHQKEPKPDPNSQDLQEAYTLLAQAELCPQAWRPLVQKAQIEALRLQGRLQEAGQKASDLAKSECKDKASLLFIAAQSFASSTPEKSIEIYEKLIKEEGTLAKKAAENLMHLFIQQQNYSALIDARHMLKKSLPFEAHDSLTFFLAEAYFQKGDYLKVFHLLKEPLKGISPSQKRRMHVLAAFSAHKIGNASHVKVRLDALFEQRELTECETEVALICAKHALEEGDPKSAERTLVQLKKRRFPKDKLPSIDLLSAAIAYQSGRTEEAFNLAIDLAEQESICEKDISLLCDILSVCARKSAEQVKSLNSPSLERFMTFIEMQEVPTSARLILSYLDVLTAFSKFDKMHYFLSHLPTDQVAFTNSELFNLELKRALAYEKTARFDEEIRALKQAHKAAASLGNSEKMQTLIGLFNAHFRIYKTYHAQKEKSENALLVAASYLRSAFELEPARIDPRNKRWLASFYSDYLKKVLQNKNIQPLSTDELKKAYSMLQVISKDAMVDPFDRAKITLVTLKLAREDYETGRIHFDYELNPEDAKELNANAEALREHKDSESQKLKSALFLEAGRIYYILDNLEEAKKCFGKAKGAVPFGFDTDLAKLFLYRIQLNEKTINTSEAIAVFKDIQHKKTAQHEPLFLEAALDYIEASCQGLDRQEKTQKNLFLLNRMKEDFTEVHTAVGRSYHKTLSKLSEKNALYEKYLGYVEQKIAFLELQLKDSASREQRLQVLNTIQNSVAKLSNKTIKTESYAKLDHYFKSFLEDLNASKEEWSGAD